MSCDHNTCLVITRHVLCSQDMSCCGETCLVITRHHTTCLLIKHHVFWSRPNTNNSSTNKNQKYFSIWSFKQKHQGAQNSTSLMRPLPCAPCDLQAWCLILDQASHVVWWRIHTTTNPANHQCCTVPQSVHQAVRQICLMGSACIAFRIMVFSSMQIQTLCLGNDVAAEL